MASSWAPGVGSVLTGIMVVIVGFCSGKLFKFRHNFPVGQGPVELDK
jgi:hypothetical protein